MKTSKLEIKKVERLSLLTSVAPQDYVERIHFFYREAVALVLLTLSIDELRSLLKTIEDKGGIISSQQAAKINVIWKEMCVATTHSWYDEEKNIPEYLEGEEKKMFLMEQSLVAESQQCEKNARNNNTEVCRKCIMQAIYARKKSIERRIKILEKKSLSPS
ncbi:MAG: hypothetical protein US70_C0006G0014 [Parcubacteria group bacterium GW2011_GWD2_38_11]|nr:MAG: hypothetical protein US70_C0006G0014 [Parcubacteria group bacterium GW2011_GWD2_38_11]